MDALWWGILLAGRMLPAALLVPALGGKTLVLPARVGLVALLSFSLTPALAPVGPAPSGLPFLGLLLKELAVGAVLAFSGSCLFALFELAGRLVGELGGIGRFSQPHPLGGEAQTPLSLLYLLLTLPAFYALGGPELFLRALRRSLELVPLNEAAGGQATAGVARAALDLSALALEGGLRMALPAAGAVFCADVVLGFSGRLCPQLPVYFVGMPLRAAMAVGVCALSLRADQLFSWFR